MVMAREKRQAPRAPAATWTRTELISIGEGRELTVPERTHVLNTALPAYLGQRNGRIVSRSPAGVTVAVPRPRPNHLLHLVLALCTLGLWVPAWIATTSHANTDDEWLVTVDVTGSVSATPCEEQPERVPQPEGSERPWRR